MTQTKGTVLIAGATGYLGHYLLRAYAEADYTVRALARDAEKLTKSDLWIDEIFVGEATDPETLVGACDGVSLVVSAIGITRQRDGLTYLDVDYQANRNLLDLALIAGVKRFAYIHVLNAENMPGVAMARAKSKFARELKEASIESTLICPSGFFSDLTEILSMAQRGRVYLFGDGEAQMSPIHGFDLAQLCVQATESNAAHVAAGGPQTFSQNEIAELAFAVLGQSPRITHVPLWLSRAIMALAKRLGMRTSIGPIEFFLEASALDMSAAAHGTRTLAEEFSTHRSTRAAPV
ncbi:MAG: SDR family oxidoreductase [Hyphomonas sp.]|nr:SDR family oxidoreductase [Hyphomonas sp.]